MIEHRPIYAVEYNGFPGCGKFMKLFTSLSEARNFKDHLERKQLFRTGDENPVILEYMFKREL